MAILSGEINETASRSYFERLTVFAREPNRITFRPGRLFVLTFQNRREGDRFVGRFRRTQFDLRSFGDVRADRVIPEVANAGKRQIRAGERQQEQYERGLESQNVV